jgi:hypothetical protein
MSPLLKSGLWILIVGVVVFFFTASGVSGPTTEKGTLLAEAAMVAAPVGLLLCIAAGVKAIIRKPD